MTASHLCLARPELSLFQPRRFCRKAISRTLLATSLALIPCCGSAQAATADVLLPTPRKVEVTSGSFDPCQAHLVLAYAAEDQRPAELIAHAIQTLCGTGPALATGPAVSAAITLEDDNTLPALAVVGDQPGPRSREAYQLSITAAQIKIHARSTAGIDEGAQTLLQMLHQRTHTHPQLPAEQIADWPALAFRGLMLDTAHGSRPTVAFLHQLLDGMEQWKLNQLYFYAETNLPLTNPTPVSAGNRWSAEEIRDLVSYAAERHIVVVPCVEFYGHLHDLFSQESQSPHAAMVHGGELNPADPSSSELVSSWMHQLATLFPSPWIHLGFDEPFELDRMDANARHQIPPDRLWSDHLRRCAELAARLGKKPLFWADIDEGAFLFNKYPQLASELPPDAIAVPWFYDPRADYSPLFSLFEHFHVPLMVAPAVSDWDDIFPDYAASFVNIHGMVKAGRKVGATGMINTIWSDSALALHRSALPGVAYGAAISWQSSDEPAEGFFARYARLTGSQEEAGTIAGVYQELTDAEALLKSSLGAEPEFRIFDPPFDPAYLRKAKDHKQDLISARLHLESALHAIESSIDRHGESAVWITLEAQARCMDYSALRALYAKEIAENFRALPPALTADDLHYRLGWETASRNHSRVGDLIDRSGECLDIYRKAWLSEALPYRLHTAEARWQHEQQFWISFQERVWQFRRDFKPGDPRPTLDDLAR